MSDVDKVALWVGLIAGIVSIVLAIVAVWFTIVVDRRSRDVTAQMIRSLQKIESTVERSSGDTVDLIKVAWERLLGSVGTGPPAPATDEDAIKSIAAGVTAELKAELAARPSEGDAATSSETAALAAQVELLSARLEETLRAQAVGSASADPMERAVQGIASSSPLARELIAQLLSGGHLTRDQYVRLEDSILGDAIAYLRRRGLIGPARGRAADGSEELVYWFRPGMNRYLKAALNLVGHEPGPYEHTVRDALQGVGYPQPWLEKKQSSD